LSPGIFEELFTSWKLREETAVDLDSASDSGSAFSARGSPAGSLALSGRGSPVFSGRGSPAGSPVFSGRGSPAGSPVFSGRGSPAGSPVFSGRGSPVFSCIGSLAYSDYGGYLEDDLKETGKKGMSVQVIALTNHGTIHLNDWF